MKKIILVIVALSFSFGAQADYVRGQFGYTLSGEIDGDGSLDLDSEFLSPLTIAYGKTMSEVFSLEYEFVRYSNDAELSSLVSADVLGLALNGIYNITTKESSVVSPYVGAGILLGMYKVSIPNDDEDGFGVGLHLIAGLDFEVSEGFSIGTQLRYGLTIVDPDLGGTDLSFNHMSLGLTGKFQL